MTLELASAAATTATSRTTPESGCTVGTRAGGSASGRPSVRELYLRGFEPRPAGTPDPLRSEAHRGSRGGRYETFERRRILTEVVEHPGTTVKESLERLTGIDRRTINRNLARLRADGFVERDSNRAGGSSWKATPRGISEVLAIAKQLRFDGFDLVSSDPQGQFVHEGLREAPVGYHVQIAPLSMALEAADRANQTMRSWGVWSRTIRNAWRYLGLKQVLRSVRETAKRALNIRNLGAYLHRVLWSTPQDECAHAVAWALRNPNLLGGVAREIGLQTLRMATEVCSSVRQVWRFVHSVKRAIRGATARGRSFDAGDVYAIACYVSART